MKEELQKKFEAAAGDYCHTHDIQETTPWHHASIDCFVAGAEHGYREAVMAVEEWLGFNAGLYLEKFRKEGIVGSVFKIAKMIVDLETEMNKFLDEK